MRGALAGDGRVRHFDLEGLYPCRNRNAGDGLCGFMRARSRRTGRRCFRPHEAHPAPLSKILELCQLTRSPSLPRLGRRAWTVTSPWVEFQKGDVPLQPARAPIGPKASRVNGCSPLEGRQKLAPTKPHHVEPDDLPPRELEAKAIFVDAGWPSQDAEWLARTALRVFDTRAPEESDHILPEWVKRNIEVVARAWPDASPIWWRDRALLIAFARICGCGGSKATLAQVLEPFDESGAGDGAGAGLDSFVLNRQHIANDFLAEHPGCKKASFEAALIQGGWPGDYGSGAQVANDLSAYALERFRGSSHEHNGGPEIVRLMRLLADSSIVALDHLIDSDAVVAAGSRRGKPDARNPLQPRVPPTLELKEDPGTNARSLLNWTLALGPRALRLFHPKFAECLEGGLAGAMASGVRDVVERWLLRSGSHPEFFREAGRSLGDATRPYFQALHARCATQNETAPEPLRRAWLWFTWCSFTADESGWQSVDFRDRELILRAATEDVSRMRKLFARARPRPLVNDERERMARILARHGESLPPPSAGDLCQGWGYLLPPEAAGHVEETQRAPWEEFEWERDHLRVCLMVLVEFGGLWRGLKPMLVAWRSLVTPAVARDLRYWDERDEKLEPPPRPWSDLVGLPINLFHAYAAREEAADPGLDRLRGEFTNFCLDRLTDRWSKAERKEALRVGRTRTDQDMLERDPRWRYCLVRAVASLGINPEGKGHRVLRVSADLDPDALVREAANQAYEQLRRGAGLPEGVSARRAIMTAFWWLRQAHLLGLGIQPDPDGAQRTRAKEVTRTRDAEQPISRTSKRTD